MTQEAIVIGHRGAAGLAPENTMPAFERAMAEGADWVECDVRTTKDDRFVILHDASLDRTTSGKGRVNQWPLHKIRALDAGSWFQPRYRGEHVPILEEVLDWAKDRMGLILDCKEIVPRDLAALLRRFQMTKGILIAFENLNDVRKFRAADPRTPTALTTARSIPLPPVAKAGCRFVNVKNVAWGRAFAEKAGAVGLSVNVWTVNRESEIREASAHRPHGLITDFPDRVRTAMALAGAKA